MGNEFISIVKRFKNQYFSLGLLLIILLISSGQFAFADEQNISSENQITTDYFGWIKNAINGVSDKVDGIINFLSGTKPTLPKINTNNRQAEFNQITPVQQSISISPTPTSNIKSNLASTINQGATTVGQQVVYQVIERAVPGPQGPVGQTQQGC